MSLSIYPPGRAANYALLRATAMPPDHQSYCYAEESYRQGIELARLSWTMCSLTQQGLDVQTDSKIGQSQSLYLTIVVRH
jgi:hypothetical protein